jgi:uncharacterized membrane protein
MQQSAVTGPMRSFVVGVDRFASWMGRHWLATFILLYGALVLTPFLAPVLMENGLTGAADGVYFFYSFLCHQLPERSIFIFGQKPMYSYAEIKAVWPLDGFAGLRQFIGNPDMGYKVAWSDRMISTYGGIWLGGLIYALAGKRVPRLSPMLWLLLGVFPIGVDGLTHMANDIVAGTTGLGFRDTNIWLQMITGNLLPSSFYVGDAFGSFNSWARWITGLLFGLTTVWAFFPLVESAMLDVAHQSDKTLKRASERG